MKKTGEMIPGTYQSSKAKKTSSPTRVHASKEPILCRGIDCKEEFLPKRRDQVYCSPDCRSKYFNVARGIGVILLERSKTDLTLKVIVDGLLKILRNLDEIGETE